MTKIAEGGAGAGGALRNTIRVTAWSACMLLTSGSSCVFQECSLFSCSADLSCSIHGSADA